MRILMLPSFYPPNGGEFCTEQANALSQRGVEVHVLANVQISIGENGLANYLKLPYVSQEKEEDGLLTIRNYIRRTPRSPKISFLRWVNKTLSLYNSYEKRHGAPDIIHVHSCRWAGYAASLIKSQKGIPYVITEHISFDLVRNFEVGQSEYLTQKMKEAYASADYLLPVSEKLYRDGFAYINQRTPYRVVSNILDVDQFVPSGVDKKNDVFTFVCINSFCHWKGYDILLKAIDIVAEQNYDFEVIIAGGGFDSAEFDELFQKMVHRNKIKLVGMLGRKEVIALLDKADAMALPSRSEAQPRTILESLAMGKPVVCTSIVPKSVVTPQVGIRVSNENAIEFASGMVRLMKHRIDYDAAKLRNHVLKIAHPDVVVKAIKEIYDEVISNKK